MCEINLQFSTWPSDKYIVNKEGYPTIVGCIKFSYTLDQNFDATHQVKIVGKATGHNGIPS